MAWGLQPPGLNLSDVSGSTSTFSIGSWRDDITLLWTGIIPRRSKGTILANSSLCYRKPLGFVSKWRYIPALFPSLGVMTLSSPTELTAKAHVSLRPSNGCRERKNGTRWVEGSVGQPRGLCHGSWFPEPLSLIARYPRKKKGASLTPTWTSQAEKI